MTDSDLSPTQRAEQTYYDCFDEKPLHTATAPGRVNLIGEHTDYNDGFVFPVAIEFHTAVAAGQREDRDICVVAHDENNQTVQFCIDEAAEFDEQASWSNYVRGVVAELRGAGYLLAGANLAISGNVPMGAGLSSSASLEIAVIKALTELSQEPIDAVTAARLGQAAENNFVGCQCGIMDQLISAAGRSGQAMQLDCRSLEMSFAPLPTSLTLLVIDSKLQRRLVDGAYNERRLQCEQVAHALQVKALRDVSLEDLEGAQKRLDPTAYRRARHVVTENNRTLEMVEALRADDIPRVSELMAASHISMRDDFEITTPEIDALVSLIFEIVGARGGVRMTGGGFGGCVVALLPPALVPVVVAQIDQDYPAIAGHRAHAFNCQASAGAFA